MKKKLFLIFILIYSISLFSACSNEQNENSLTQNQQAEFKEDSPQFILKSFFDAFKSSKFDEMKSYMADGIWSFDEITQNKSSIIQHTLNTAIQNFEYKIKESTIQEDSAEVTVDMKNIWMSEVMLDSYSDYALKGTDAPGSDQATVELEFLKFLKANIEKYQKQEKFTTTVVITLIKNNEKWEIVNDSAIFDGMTGEYITFLSRNLKNFVTPQKTEDEIVEITEE